MRKELNEVKTMVDDFGTKIYYKEGWPKDAYIELLENGKYLGFWMGEPITTFQTLEKSIENTEEVIEDILSYE